VKTMRATVKSAARRPGQGSAAKPLQARTAPSDAIGPSDSASAPTGFAARPGPAPDAADIKGKLPERLAALAAISLGDLRLEWRRLYRAEPPRLSRDIMTRAIAYRLQEIAHGGLSKVTRRRLMTLAESFDVDGRIAAPVGPRIKSGSRLIREWHGRTHTVCVTDSGFEFEGRTYASLTKIARDITGAQWSGPRFFGLTKTPASARSGGATNGGANSIETISDYANG
jgi:Protein of unknown function (DUF2924)